MTSKTFIQRRPCLYRCEAEPSVLVCMAIANDPRISAHVLEGLKRGVLFLSVAERSDAVDEGVREEDSSSFEPCSQQDEQQHVRQRDRQREREREREREQN